MSNLGPSFFLLLALTAPPIQCQFPKSHVTVNNIGQAYQANAAGDATKIGEVLETIQHPKALAEIPAGNVYIAIAASNFGNWSKLNPAGILLSTDTEDITELHVTDSSWKCKGYPDDGTGRNWPTGNNRGNDIKAFVADFNSQLPAVQLSQNWDFNHGTIERIQLGANWIWYAGLGEGDNDNLPPKNVICMKKFAD